jgi:hypothetical protein
VGRRKHYLIFLLVPVPLLPLVLKNSILGFTLHPVISAEHLVIQSMSQEKLREKTLGK